MTITLDRLIKLLRNRNFILLLSFFLGLTLHQGARWTSRFFVPLIVFVMTLSMTSITGEIFQNPRRLIKPIMLSIAMNYLVLGGSMILLAYVMRLPQSYLVGFIVLAAVPPAVAVIPFTNFLGGDPDFSLVGFIACYLGAFIITPLTLTVFLGSQPGFQARIITLLVELIVLPFILSRLLVRFKVDDAIKPFKGTLINWSFFIVIYAIVGLNRMVFVRDPFSLTPLLVIVVLVTFIMGFLVENISDRLGVDAKTIMSLVLLGTSKNSGFAAGITIALFSAESTVPSTVTTVLMLLYVIYLDLRKRGS